MFKLKHGHKLESETPEATKLFGCIKKLIDETTDGKNRLNFEVV